MKNMKMKNIIFMFVSIILIGLGIAVFVKSGTGSDPFTALTIAMSHRLGMSLTLFQGGLNLLILIIVMFFDRSKVFIGTIVAMFFLAPVIEFWDALLNLLIVGNQGIMYNLVLMFIGCIIFVLGAGVYLGADVGVAPYDMIGVIISERKGIAYKWVRMSTDLVCVLIAVAFGGVIGLGTICTGLLLGPIAGYVKDKVARYLSA
ncbi:MAG: YczE/YyaS/YitT family protein [Cellulosilyticaceae bacterium]